MASSLLKNKHVLVVGGTKGLGGAVVDALSEVGAKVTFTGRFNAENRKGEFIPSDVSTIKGTKDLAHKLKGKDFDTVLFTVGIFSKNKLERNAEGIEMDLAVSYLSRYVLVQEFCRDPQAFPQLKRIFVMGYPGQNVQPTDIEDINFEHAEYKQFPAHMNTVLFNEALVFETHRRYHPRFQVYGLSPGLIPTGIRDNVHGGTKTWFGWFMEKSIAMFAMSPQTYATKTVLPLLANDDLVSPASFSQKGKPIQPGPWVDKEENRIRTWEVSEALVNKVLSQQ